MPDTWGQGEPYEQLMGRWSRLLAPRFCEWVRIPRGATVLDVGCGTGALSAVLIELGAREVVGVDPSPGYVKYAEAAVGGASKNARFEVGDATKLRFADGTFDVVLSSLVLNFVQDPGRAAAEMHRVARRGGAVAACVWDYAGCMELLHHFWDGATLLDPKAGRLDEGGRFPICNPRALTELFRGADLVGVATTGILVPMVFRDFEGYWRPFLGGQGPSGAYAMSLTETEREKLRGLLQARLPTGRDGSIPLTARAWAVRGTPK